MLLRSEGENTEGWRGFLTVDLSELEGWGFGSATKAVSLPKPKPRAVRVDLVVPAIGSHKVPCAKRSGIRHCEYSF
jgi:hypothetical protein